LIDEFPRLYLMNGQNPFQVTIFDKILEGYSLSDLQKAFGQKLAGYSLEMNRLQNFCISHQHREKQGRVHVLSFSDAIKKKQREVEQQQDYKFKICEIEEEKQLQMSNSLILQRVIDIIHRKEAEGVSQKNERFVLRDVLMQECLTENHVNTFNRLFVEANIELGGLIKLPALYKRYIPYLANVKRERLLNQLIAKIDSIESKVRQEQIEFVQANLDQKFEIATPSALAARRDPASFKLPALSAERKEQIDYW